ncbi:MAG: hypothetical protein L6R40_005226 [Gallowayella cf. fulva]|nr:MAG: hypothetical protein L6R40_005226 [Xanthomendoza cf. fulva]
MQQPQRPWAENDDTQIWLIAFLTYQINEFMIGNKATGADLSAVKLSQPARAVSTPPYDKKIRWIGDPNTFGNVTGRPVVEKESSLVLATGLQRVVRSRASGQHYSSNEVPNIAGVDGAGETSDGQIVFFLCSKEGGSFAEWINVPRRNTMPLPSGLTPVQAAALLNPALSFWMALTARCDNLPDGFSVLIMGAASASRRLAIPLARALGSKRVIDCARNEESLKLLGLDEQIVLQEPADSTDCSKLGHVGVILDYVYGPAAVHLLKSLKAAGRVQYVHIGALAAHFDLSALEISLPGSVLRHQKLTIRGSGLGSWGLQEVGAESKGVLQSLVTVRGENISERRRADVERVWDESGTSTLKQPDPSSQLQPVLPNLRL